jgi:glycosyltransferase involved in cell wall biosynthesis
MESYRFTIIIPNYNNGKWLDKMFGSIAAQTYENYEVTFVDDCSTDNSVEIAEKWATELS